VLHQLTGSDVVVSEEAILQGQKIGIINGVEELFAQHVADGF
jgi:hypothetical protein